MFGYGDLVRADGFVLAVAETEFAVVDLETTGFSPQQDRVVEIAVVRVRGDGTVLEEWSTLVQPDRTVGATAVHGITQRDVVGAPRFGELTGELGRLFSGAVVTAHNAAFEERFLRAEFERAGVRPPTTPALCTMRLARAVAVPVPNHKLATCCDHFGVALLDAHTALADARATAAIMPLAFRHGAVERICYPCPLPGWGPAVPFAGQLRQRGAARRAVLPPQGRPVSRQEPDPAT